MYRQRKRAIAVFSKAVYICKKKINMIQMKRNVEGNLLLERFVARESSQTLDEKT